LIATLLIGRYQEACELKALLQRGSGHFIAKPFHLNQLVHILRLLMVLVGSFEHRGQP
jgi:hypothetical protein